MDHRSHASPAEQRRSGLLRRAFLGLVLLLWAAASFGFWAFVVNLTVWSGEHVIALFH